MADAAWTFAAAVALYGMCGIATASLSSCWLRSLSDEGADRMPHPRLLVVRTLVLLWVVFWPLALAGTLVAGAEDLGALWSGSDQDEDQEDSDG